MKYSILIGGLFFCASCNNNNSLPPKEDNKLTVTTNNNFNSNTLDEITRLGIYEHKMAALALDKAYNPTVRTFGERLLNQQLAFNKAVQDINDELEYTAKHELSESQQASIDVLSSKSSIDFDTTFLRMVIDQHENYLQHYRSEKQYNDKIDYLINQNLSIWEQHVQDAKDMLNSYTGK